MLKTRATILLSTTYEQRLLCRGTKLWNTLVDKIKEDEATSKTQAEAQKREIEDLRKQLARAKEERILEETK